MGKHLDASILLYLWVWGAHHVYIKNKHGDIVEQNAKVTQISQYYRYFELAATFIGVLTGPLHCRGSLWNHLKYFHNIRKQ